MSVPITTTEIINRLNAAAVAAENPKPSADANYQGFLQIDNSYRSITEIPDAAVKVVDRAHKSQFSDVVKFVKRVFQEKNVSNPEKRQIVNSFRVLTEHYREEAKESGFCRFINRVFGEDSLWHRVFNTKTAVLRRADDFIKENVAGIPSTVDQGIPSTVDEAEEKDGSVPDKLLDSFEQLTSQRERSGEKERADINRLRDRFEDVASEKGKKMKEQIHANVNKKLDDIIADANKKQDDIIQQVNSGDIAGAKDRLKKWDKDLKKQQGK